MPSTDRRIYRVSGVNCKHRLVRAVNRSQALRHVAADTLTVAVASQDDLVYCFDNGIKVEDVKAEAADV